MESHDSQNAFIIEKPAHSLHHSLGTDTRRKRREIRLLRKLTCTPTPSRGLNVLQHGVPTKRAGLRSLHGCDSLYLLDNGVHEEEACPGDITPRTSAEKLSKFVVNGLIRSRSYPPEDWQTRRYILEASRLGRSMEKGELNPLVSSVDSCIPIASSKSLGSTDGFADSLHQLKSMVECPVPQVDVADAKDGGTSLHKGLESCCSEVNLSHEKDVDMNIGVNQPTDANSMSPDAVTNGLYLAGKTALLQSVEGSLLDSVRQGALEVKLRRQNTNCPPSGKVLICGRRRVMEDTAVIVPSFAQLPRSAALARTVNDGSCDLHFYGVYDGHGGSQASCYCAERLHHALVEEIARCSLTEERSGIKEWQSAMVSCFAKVDKEVGGVCPYGACDDVNSEAVCCSSSIAPDNVGTTAVVAVVSSAQIVLANCGDSRAVLSRGGKAIPLSQDHKPERADETSRIEAAGGFVVAWRGYRVGALLAVSRAIGNRILKRYVISEPDVVCLERTEEDECLILASDGLWDVIENDAACEVARRCLASARNRERCTTSGGEDFASATAAATLVKLACGKGSKDNISVVVVDLSSRQQ